MVHPVHRIDQVAEGNRPERVGRGAEPELLGSGLQPLKGGGERDAVAGLERPGQYGATVVQPHPRLALTRSTDPPSRRLRQPGYPYLLSPIARVLTLGEQGEPPHRLPLP